VQALVQALVQVALVQALVQVACYSKTQLVCDHIPC
jgi:hypothetical protein